ncbi:MAG TPA: lytic transglycosylase domain-containing protein, partial [Flavobacterium sp.]|nr:lytic transglycosylase domain-containing protein [Flavobacterium sp.]
MKKIVYALLFGLLSIGLQAQESAEKHTLTAKITQTPQAYLDSIKKTFVNHKAGAEIDKKWMQEIMNDDLFESMKDDVENAYLDKTVEYDLSTDLLKERLRNLNNKSVFNIHHNESIEKVIKNFLKNRSKSYERLMALSEYYFPLFEERLNKYDVPLEIKYLAIVESALNPNAKSRMGATGLWQFMYGTAKQYKLDINTYVDERSDPVKSTEAAVKYLRDLYDVFGNWELALAS